MEAGLLEDVLYPVTYEAEDVSTVSESFGSSIGGMLGMLLITTILLGAIYPSIDAMAGERESCKLETLLTLPVTNFQIIMSKYISVSVFACVTAVISLLSLGGSVLFIYFGLIPGTLSELQDISILSILPVIPMVLLTLLVTALLVTAFCMCFCVFARSFKEANNYITPAMLVIMIVSMVGIVPSMTLDTRTALIPIANVSLLIKDLTSQTFSWPLAVLTTAVNFGYSVIIVWILSKLYNSEAVLFSDGLGSFRMFRKRSEIRPGTMPAIGDATVAVIVLLLLMLYAGSALTLRSVTGGTVLTQLLILVTPLLLTWYLKSDTKTLFLLKKPRLSAIPGTVLLYVGAYFTGIALSLFLSALFPQSMENLESSYSSLLELSIWGLLLIMAVMPAIGEELLFRGLIFGTLRIRAQGRIGQEKKVTDSASIDAEGKAVDCSASYLDGDEEYEARMAGMNAQARQRGVWAAIAISSLIFAAFHMSLVKLPSTFLLGAAFAYADYMGGSIFLSMVLHFLNNTASVLVMKYPEQMAKWFPILTKESFTLAEVILMLV
ncbi:MAG: CPBP family glutamic-type intramembrane protease [Lachnospiraceae bacterium]|nr:CPBP family glutamic-type intramembrane protease [Lachnospiraceae bacterium]